MTLRLTNDLWSIQGAARTIYQLKGVLDFRVAEIALQALQGLDEPLQGPLHVAVSGNGNLNGRWKITLVGEAGGVMHRIRQFIPYTFEYPAPANTRVIAIERDDPTWHSNFRWKFWAPAPVIPSVSISETVAEPVLNTLCTAWLFDRQVQLATAAYADPFSTLAARCLQTVERDYISERAIRGQHYFGLALSGVLTLHPWDAAHPPVGDALEDMNRATGAYRDYMLREFGRRHVDYFQHEFGFNFEGMLANNSPLFPDHVYKSNVGGHSIEEQHIAELYLALRKIAFSGSDLDELHLVSSCFENLADRELRALIKAGNLATQGDLKTYILRCFSGQPHPSHIGDLTPETIHTLASLLLPQDEATWQRLFTGRQITHQPVTGFKTLGNDAERDPSRNLSEFLQTFGEMERAADFREQSELLAHIAVKKEMFRACCDGTWRVGSVFPLGQDARGVPTYYVVRALLDDDHGDVNYVCVPLCTSSPGEDGKIAPLIKLYRSTASSKSNMNWWDSIAADLNSEYGGPNSTAPELGDEVEQAYFKDCTIPVWVGYLFMGEQATNRTTIRDHYTHAWTSAFADRPIPDSLEEMRDELYRLAEEQHELPRHKKRQDVHFVGHSLGASLAQFGTYYFGPRLNRIPLPGCYSRTYAGDAPGIDNDTDTAFFEFGRLHRQMLATLGIRYDIHYDFEYRDAVAQAGECHLGTSRYHEDDQDWLSVDIRVNRATDDPSLPEVRLLPTHGRRFGKDGEMTSHTVTKLTPQQLHAFDSSWMLRGELNEIFGFAVLRSPAGTELMRKGLGKIRRPFGAVAKRVYEHFHPPLGTRDGNGVFLVRCEPQPIPTHVPRPEEAVA